MVKFHMELKNKGVKTLKNLKELQKVFHGWKDAVDRTAYENRKAEKALSRFKDATKELEEFTKIKEE